MPSSKKPSPFDNLKNVARPAGPPQRSSTAATSSDTSAVEANARTSQLAVGMSTRKLPGALLMPVDLLTPNSKQVRTEYNQETIEELANDIKERGILEPLLVRETEPGQYEIIAGQRRYLAARHVGLVEVPVIVKELTDREARLTMLVENIQRENLSFNDEREFFLTLQNEFNYSITDIAALIHKSRYYVRARLEGKAEEESLSTLSDSAENHNLVKTTELYNNSQSGEGAETGNRGGRPKSGAARPFVYRPKTFQKIGSTFEAALSYVEQGVEPKIASKLKTDLEELKKKLEQLQVRLDEQEKQLPKKGK